MEWEGESVGWKENEIRAMRATEGLPARMNMRIELRFETVDSGKTKVTCVIRYMAPYPLAGPIMDWLYLRHGARRPANSAIEGLKTAVAQRRIPPVTLQFENRRLDHPGYELRKA
jgi:hypothetical protein